MTRVETPTPTDEEETLDAFPEVVNVLEQANPEVIVKLFEQARCDYPSKVKPRSWVKREFLKVAQSRGAAPPQKAA